MSYEKVREALEREGVYEGSLGFTSDMYFGADFVAENFLPDKYKGMPIVIKDDLGISYEYMRPVADIIKIEFEIKDYDYVHKYKSIKIKDTKKVARFKFYPDPKLYGDFGKYRWGFKDETGLFEKDHPLRFAPAFPVSLSSGSGELYGGSPDIPLDDKYGYRRIEARDYDFVVDKDEVDLDFIKKYLIKDFEGYDITYNIIDDFPECVCCENCNRAQYGVLLDHVSIDRCAKNRTARIHIWLTHDYGYW